MQGLQGQASDPGGFSRAFANVSRPQPRALPAERKRRFRSVPRRVALYSARSVFNRGNSLEREDCKSFRFGCRLVRAPARFSSVSFSRYGRASGRRTSSSSRPSSLRSASPTPLPSDEPIAAFLIFCALSGTVYLVNDVFDREQDRRHPLKAKRPIAAGEISPKTALIAAVLLGCRIARGVAGARTGILRRCGDVSGSAFFLFRVSQAHRHSRRLDGGGWLYAARRGRGGRDIRTDQPLAARLHDAARAVHCAEQAAS